MHLDWYSAQRTVNDLCNRSDIQIVFEDGIDQPRTDYRTIYVQKPSPEWDTSKVLDWQGRVYHEYGHNVGDMLRYKKFREDYKIVNNTLPGVVFNIVEDYDNERYELGILRGKDKAIEHTRKLLTEKLRAIFPTNPVNVQTNVFEAIQVIFQQFRDWQPSVYSESIGIENNLSTQGKQFYDLLSKQNLKMELDSYKGDPSKSWEITLRILDSLGFNVEEEVEKMQKKFKSVKSGEESNNDSKEGEAQSLGESSSGEDKESSSEDEEAIIKFKDLMNLDHSGYKHKSKGLTITYDKDDFLKGGYIPSTIHEMKINDYPNNKIQKVGYKSPPLIINETAAALVASKFRRLLQILSQKKVIHNQKKGKLSTKTLHRLALPIESSNQWEKIFKKRDSKLDLNVTVTVLVDGSGSMSGSKWYHAAYAQILIHRMLKTLGIKHELLSFSELDEYLPNSNNPIPYPLHSIIKGYNDNVSEEHIKDYLGALEYLAGANNDVDAILWAYSRLRTKKENRKLLIVLSDGQPVSARPNAIVLPKTLKDVVKQIEEETNVEIYSIGIMSESVKHFYKNYRVINNSSQLEEALLSLISNRIIGD